MVRVNGHRVLTRAAVGIISKNVQFILYRNLSYGALDSCLSGAEGEQSRQPCGSWSPHVIGLVSVGLLFCSGKKGEMFKLSVTHVTSQPNFNR